MAFPLFEKIWQRHTVLERDGVSLLYVGRHLIHDGSRNAFRLLREKQLPTRRPDRSFGTADHFVPSLGRDIESMKPDVRDMVMAFGENTRSNHITFYGLQDARQGIIHVVGPEQGLCLPGLLMACGDSHTATQGAFGAAALGIGESDVGHVLATQTLWQSRPKHIRLTLNGRLRPGVTAKDLILALIARFGSTLGSGSVIEYAGEAVRGLSMEARMTLCNMSTEAGARAGIIAPDDVTFSYLYGLRYAPHGEQWEAAMRYWRTLYSDDSAVFHREESFDAAGVEPMVTWGTSLEAAAPISGVVPDPARIADAGQRKAMEQELAYMDLAPGTRMADIAVDRVFIGSCTNGRIEDLRAAAAVIKGRKVCVPAIVVPGSGPVKSQAEAEGLHHLFLAAGFEWRDPSCSMCTGTNGDVAVAGERCVSTANRNFKGRQGKDVKTHIVSPAMAAAAAVCGRFTDASTF
jgi:3-isopropylmalate/(R)-2-methylmalate dehydratase large subunit